MSRDVIIARGRVLYLYCSFDIDDCKLQQMHAYMIFSFLAKQVLKVARMNI